MKSLLLVVFAITALISGAFAAPSAKDTLAAIDKVEVDPFSDEGRNAAKIVLSFADGSDAVTITLSSKIAPWLFESDASKSEIREDAANVLLAVYLAGNLKSQISAGVAKDDPYAGWLSVIRVYRRLQRDRKIHFPSIERLMVLEERGDLKKEASKAVKAR